MPVTSPQANKVSPTNGNKEYEVTSNGVKVKTEDVKPPKLANKPVKSVLIVFLN